MVDVTDSASDTTPNQGSRCRRFQNSRRLASWMIVCILLVRAYQNSPIGLAEIITSQTKLVDVLSRRRDILSSGSDDVGSQQLNDRTISIDPNISRHWINDSSQSQAPYKLILTDVGWNHPNASYGLRFSRSKRSRELLQGTVDHPNFDPTIHWSQVVNGTQILDPDTRYYVFLDVETCFESNYPHYGDGFQANSDLEGGRSFTTSNHQPCFFVANCHFVFTALDTIYQYPNATLVVYNCRGNGPGPRFRKELAPTKQLCLVSESAPDKDVNTEIDQGLTPGPLNVVKLRQDEINSIISCNDTDRPFLVTFVGAPKTAGPRQAMIYNMSNGRDVLFLSKQAFEDKYFFLTFHESLKKSAFGAAPKGDNLYSYRFTEVLSAGAIPVVHADGWVMPFHKALFDWNESCAVVIPEARVHDTERILRSISKEERCRRQRNCLEIYQKYFMTPHGTVRGIVESLERIHEQGGL